LNSVPFDRTADGRQIAAGLLPRFRALDQFAQGLAASYAEALDEATPKRPDTKP
jgi:hypothetical protein